jgi:hypothetical protein
VLGEVPWLSGFAGVNATPSWTSVFVTCDPGTTGEWPLVTLTGEVTTGEVFAVSVVELASCTTSACRTAGVVDD